LNTLIILSLKYDNTKLNVDASGIWTVIGGTSQWTTTGSDIYYNTGKVGINNTLPYWNLDVGSANANHNIGGTIINGSIHDTNKRECLSIGRWDDSGEYVKF